MRGYVTHGPAVGETRGPAVGAAHRPSVGARAAALLSLLTLGADVVLLLVGVVLHIAAVLVLRSPAARTVRLLSSSTITELGRVVAGRPAA